MFQRGHHLSTLSGCSPRGSQLSAGQAEQPGLSSGHVLPGQPSPVVVTEGLVYRPDVAVDQVLHLWGEGLRVMRAPAVPPEAAFLIVLHAEQPLLTHGHVEEGHHLPQRRHQAAPQLLVVHDQQPLAVLEPVQDVRRPPGCVAVDEVWPLWGGGEGCHVRAAGPSGCPGKRPGSPTTYTLGPTCPNVLLRKTFWVT